MARADGTRSRIVAAAERLYYAEGVRAVSMDAVAEKAGVTKRTLYNHFRSKDDLVAAYLEARDQPNLAALRRWHDAAEGGPAARVAAIFDQLARAASHATWRGCGFLRTSAELAALPGHPAVQVARRHKRGFEDWLAATLEGAGAAEPRDLARQILVLLDGSFAVVQLHRDPGYMAAAGRAAAALVAAALVAGAPPREPLAKTGPADA